MARRKFRWDLCAYGDPAKNAIIKHAHQYGADLKHGDTAWMLFKSDKLGKTTCEPVRFWRRTTTGFYAEVTTDSGHKATAFFKYSKGFMVYAVENDAILQQLLHTIGRASRLKVEAESWEEEMERLVALVKSRDTKW